MYMIDFFVPPVKLRLSEHILCGIVSKEMDQHCILSILSASFAQGRKIPCSHLYPGISYQIPLPPQTDKTGELILHTEYCIKYFGRCLCWLFWVTLIEPIYQTLDL